MHLSEQRPRLRRLCGAARVVLFGQTKGHLLPELLKLPNGIPSHDTFNRVFQTVDCEALRGCLTNHGRDILDVLAEKQICFDGRGLRGHSPQSRGNSGLYIINAWVAENRLCMGQQKVCDKSNEIEIIPGLLSELDITGAVVTVEAMGCQKRIARQITGQKGHYLLAVKENHRELFQEVCCAFKAS